MRHSLYPDAGWGGMFNQWAWLKQTKPYNSLGNGSAMRVSPIGFAFDSLEETLNEAARSAAVTHNHPEGIKGAQATAAAMWLARHGHDQPSIRRELESRFAYNLSRSLNDIRPTYSFDETCPGSVPEAIIAFLESTATKMPSARPSPSAAMPTRKPASPAESRKPSTPDSLAQSDKQP
jgi:ADP-ribosylglycohydrolase